MLLLLPSLAEERYFLVQNECQLFYRWNLRHESRLLDLGDGKSLSWQLQMNRPGLHICRKISQRSMGPGESHPLHRLWKEKLTRVGSTCPHNPVQLGKTEILQRQGRLWQTERAPGFTTRESRASFPIALLKLCRLKWRATYQNQNIQNSKTTLF